MPSDQFVDALATPDVVCFKCEAPIYFKPVHFYQTQVAIREVKRLQSVVRQLDQRNIELSGYFDDVRDEILAIGTAAKAAAAKAYRHSLPVFLTDTSKD